MSLLPPMTSESIGWAGDSSSLQSLFFSARQTVLSQYANSPVLLSLIDSLNEAIDPQADVDAFYATVWDISTAVGFGLDIWGRILGVGRTLYIAAPGEYWGFSEATDAQNFNAGTFYVGEQLTANYAMTDEAYRRVLLAKAALNITDGSISSINTILMALFPAHGNCYARDNLDMTMTYVFGAALTQVESAIIAQSGVLPRPVGVSVTVETP